MQDIDPVDLIDSCVRTTPPLTVSFLNLSNVYLSNAVYTLTALYVLFQIIVLFPKVIRTLTGKENKDVK